MKFPGNLIAARRRAGISQAALASKIGVGKSTVAEWETDKYAPSIRMLPTIAAALKVTVTALVK